MGGTGRPNECKLGFSPRNLRRALLQGRSGSDKVSNRNLVTTAAHFVVQASRLAWMLADLGISDTRLRRLAAPRDVVPRVRQSGRALFRYC